MGSDNAQRVQGAGPSCTDGDPIQVCPEPGATWNVSGSPAADVVLTHTFAPNGSWTVNTEGYTSATLQVDDAAFTWNGRLAYSHSADGVNYDDTGIFYVGQSFSFGALDETGPGFSVPGISALPITGTKTIQFIAFGGSAGAITLTLRLSVNPNIAWFPFRWPLLQATPYSFTSGLAVLPMHLEAVGETGTIIPEAYRGLPDAIPASKTFALRATSSLLFNGATLDRKRTPASFQSSQANAAGNTALWTPAAGKKFRLMRYLVTVTGDAEAAALGVVTVSLFDGAAGAIGQDHDVFVPATGTSLLAFGSQYSSGWIDLGNGVLSALANNVLNINLSAALTQGNVRVICCGTEE